MLPVGGAGAKVGDKITQSKSKNYSKGWSIKGDLKTDGIPRNHAQALFVWNIFGSDNSKPLALPDCNGQQGRICRVRTVLRCGGLVAHAEGGVKSTAIGPIGSDLTQTRDGVVVKPSGHKAACPGAR
jgi:hypothetical protein